MRGRLLGERYICYTGITEVALCCHHPSTPTLTHRKNSIPKSSEWNFRI